jgi:hypothetical protein
VSRVAAQERSGMSFGPVCTRVVRMHLILYSVIYIHYCKGVDLARGKWWIGLRDTTEPSVEEAPGGS